MLTPRKRRLLTCFLTSLLPIGLTGCGFVTAPLGTATAEVASSSVKVVDYGLEQGGRAARYGVVQGERAARYGLVQGEKAAKYSLEQGGRAARYSLEQGSRAARYGLTQGQRAVSYVRQVVDQEGDDLEPATEQEVGAPANSSSDAREN